MLLPPALGQQHRHTDQARQSPLLPPKYAGGKKKKKKSRKAVALEEHLSHSSILSPHYPAF